MEKLEPVLTEKTLKLAEEGKYTFRVSLGFNKSKIKKLVEKVFGVHVVSVKTIKEPGERKRTITGRYRKILPTKKAIVTLKEKEKIDVFETKKKG